MPRAEFLSLLLKGETSLSREFSAEIYIPNIVRKQHEDKGNVCMALRSEVSGNCLYSSVSLLLAVFFPSKTKRTISGPTCPVPSKKAKAEKKSGNISKFFSKMEKPEIITSEVSCTRVSEQTIEDLQVKPKFSHNFDVATYYERAKGLKMSDICFLIKNVFKPDENYTFPPLSENNKRSFKYEWLKDFTWLCYLPKDDGAYCLSCVLFGHQFPKLELVIKLWKIICSNVARIKVIFPRPVKTKSSIVLVR
ncbi:uncharacterized protein LOC124457170 [Xenia sp. Carnegie-2017]|uniref:uncharacterized protein LOC124457170 n=1 Tax=Xenia sp. Carnegie-2017 TaxID=2897299 RepID=UPI001F04E3BD|nr:uncharacterized protein LOC124457170 [Xenia sp. Carnegie-2017]